MAFQFLAMDTAVLNSEINMRESAAELAALRQVDSPFDLEHSTFIQLYRLTPKKVYTLVDSIESCLERKTISALSAENQIFEKSIWSFDIQNLKWTLESHLPESRRDFAVIVIDDYTETPKDRKEIGTGFYIIGGEGVNGAALDSVWFYDIKRKVWAKKASLNLGRYGLAAVMVNNEIWVAGGIVNNRMRNCNGTDDGDTSNAEIITDTMEYYSLKCAQNDDKPGCAGVDENGISWIQSNIRLRIPRLFGRFCKTSSKEVYLVGGIGISSDNVFISLAAVDRFDRQNEECVLYGDILWARHGHDVVSLNDKIIVIGGVSTIERRTLTSVESFCTKTRKSSTEIGELPWPLSGSAVVVL